MDKSGLSPSEQQRRTVAAIAKNKVLAAYSRADQKTIARQTHAQNPAVPNAAGANAANLTNTAAGHLKDSNESATVSAEEWKKYHNAWQTYYQRYYSRYYTNAARDYVAHEKLKIDRAAAEDQRILKEAGLLNSNTNTVQPAAGISSGVIAGNSEQAPSTIKSRFRARIQHQAREQAKHAHKRRHLVPILAGVIVVLIFLFLQYNRLIFAPIVAYVSPGNADATSITAVDANISQTVSAENKLIIPKINVDVPVHFGISNDTATVMEAMNNGVAQFKIPGASAMPGENGNLVITGHSAGDIYSNNQYKFIFSGLERLSEGDSIYIDYNSTRYTYQITGNKTVDPSDVAALTQSEGYPQLILITCTPLGTSQYRLLVFAKQISPSTSTTTESTDETTTNAAETTETAEMPANSDTFFESIWEFLTGQD